MFFGAAVIELTPVPNMALDVNGVTVMTDSNGEFNMALDQSGTYSVISGLPATSGIKAVTFEEIVGSGGELAAQSPYTIEMQRNIFVGGPVCRARRDGTDMAVFHYYNRTGVALTVPLEYGSLNQILSPDGDLAPPVNFEASEEPNESSFYLPLERFAIDGTYAGQWNITGQTLEFMGEPPLCSDEGGEDCTPVEPAVFDNLWKYTSRVVQSQIVKAKVLTGKTWHPTAAQRLLVMNRGSKSLAALRRELAKYQGALVCPAPTPANCTVIQVNRAAIKSHFNKLFQGTPKGLAPLDTAAAAQKKGLAKLLQAVPESITVCDGQ